MRTLMVDGEKVRCPVCDLVAAVCILTPATEIVPLKIASYIIVLLK